MAGASVLDRTWRRLFVQHDAGIGPATAALACFGILILAVWGFTKNDTPMSMLLLLAGISVVVLSILLYLFTPPKYLRSEVADAISLSNTLNLNSMLALLLVEARGIYVPSSDAGLTRVFVPVSAGDVLDVGTLKPGNETLSTSSVGVKGISLIPPGYELFRYTQSISTVVTNVNLEDIIKDVVENGLELASSVKIKAEADCVHVSLYDVTDIDLCRRVRQDAPRVCHMMGCPVCSSIACMISESTGRRVRIGNIGVDGKTIDIIYEFVK